MKPMFPQRHPSDGWLFATTMLLYLFFSSAVGAFLMPQTQQRPFMTPQLAASTGNHRQADHPVVVDPDQIRRRQLLVSMLTSASVALTSSPSSAATETTTTTTKTVLQPQPDIRLIVPPLDDSQYLTYTLPKNGLRVLLCSDPTTNEAAAAMDVHVGACADPVAVPGLAHFNEHMLFLGTKPYPQEDSFESFLSSNGGSSNAFTDSLDTVYYFDFNADGDAKFAEALQRFGAFFSEPLFTEAATGRELNAIESENAKNLQQDSFRVFQLAKARANPDHPFSKFFTGNKATLLDNTLAQGINLRNELIQFYEKYYSANQMTLAVVGPQSLEQLRAMVETAFHKIPNRSVPSPEDSWRGIPPFPTAMTLNPSPIPAFRNVVEVVPVQDIRQVTISWPKLIDSSEELLLNRLDKPNNYVAHLLGHEGPGSLLSYLKGRGWANSVASANEEELTDFESFDVVVGLTTQGLEQVDNVIEAVFSYIRMMREQPIPNYIFEEVLKLDEIQWRFMTKNGGSSYAQSLSTAMQKYPPELYVAGPRRIALSEYNLDPPLTGDPRSSFTSRAQLENTRSLVNDYLKCLTVDNAIITVLSKTFEGKTDSKEKWYGTDYRVREIPFKTLDQWRKPTPAKKLKLAYPKPNPFIPSEEGLSVRIPRSKAEDSRSRSFEDRMVPIPPPRVIRDDGPDGQWKVYFREDDRFGKPKGYLIFQVMTKEVFSSPMKAALSNLFELCATDRLTEYAYDASLAGLTYDIKVLPRGVRLTFGGYNEKLVQFAAYISRKLSKNVRDFLPQNDQEFERYKDQIMRMLVSFDVKQPYAHAAYYSTLALQPLHYQYDTNEMREATRRLTLPDLIEYTELLWKSGKGEALIQGNLIESEALKIVERITSVLPFQPIPETDVPPRIRSLPLPTSKSGSLPPILYVSEPNPSDENSCCNVMIQNMNSSEKDHVLIEILGSIVREPFYNELRTKKQLGYIVSSGVRGIGDARSLTFIVQSSVATSDSLTVEILNFLDQVEANILQKVSNADVAVYAKSLIDRKTERDKDLAVEVTRNWSEIASGRLQFDRLQQEAIALLNLEKADLIDFWRKLYLSDNRRVLVTQVIPKNGTASSKAPPRSTGYGTPSFSSDSLILGIDDIEQFRRNQEQLIV